jgi:hypothetical protein
MPQPRLSLIYLYGMITTSLSLSTTLNQLGLLVIVSRTLGLLVT